jgi:hypothetical protein
MADNEEGGGKNTPQGKRAAKKIEKAAGEQNHPSAAKAGASWLSLAARINPCPFKTGFSSRFGLLLAPICPRPSGPTDFLSRADCPVGSRQLGFCGFDLHRLWFRYNRPFLKTTSYY